MIVKQKRKGFSKKTDRPVGRDKIISFRNIRRMERKGKNK